MERKKTVVLGVTGGIAAYKAADIVSRFAKEDVEVYVILTAHATEFVRPLTFETLSAHPVAVDMFTRTAAFEVEHISWAQRADLFLIAPATANLMAKLAYGIADDMLTTTVLATKAPILLAPAMNEGMWTNPATVRNAEILKQRGVHFIGPAKGHLACGDEGEGRMEDPARIVERSMQLLNEKQDYAGKKVLITAGPTREPIDPVRYISNRSSGKMGIALARQALRRGAEVTIIHGPISAPLPPDATCVPVETTAQMRDAVLEYLPWCDVLLKAAAPSDFRAREVYPFKVKKTQNELNEVQLIQNPDILAEAAEHKRAGQIIVGFAAETNELLAHASEKLKQKKLDLMVANDVTRPGAGFETETNIVTILRKDGTIQELALAHKNTIADAVLDETATMW